MQSRSKMLRLAVATAFFLVAGSSAAQAATGTPNVPHITPEKMGITVSMTTAWRAEQHADGSVQVTFGPGTSQVPVSASTTAIATSSDQNATSPASTASSDSAAPASASDWYCEAYAPPKPTLSGSNLQSYVGVSCSGRPGSMQIEYWFSRSSWTGDRLYTDHQLTSTTTLQALGQNVYAACPSGRPGTYDYRASFEVIVNTGYLGSASAVGSADTFACGTGVS